MLGRKGLGGSGLRLREFGRAEIEEARRLRLECRKLDSFRLRRRELGCAKIGRRALSASD